MNIEEIGINQSQLDGSAAASADQDTTGDTSHLRVLTLKEFVTTDIRELPLCRLGTTDTIYVFGQPLDDTLDLDRVSNLHHWVLLELIRCAQRVVWEDLAGLIIPPEMLAALVHDGVVTTTDVANGTVTPEYVEITFSMPPRWCHCFLYGREPLNGRLLPQDSQKKLRVEKKSDFHGKYGQSADAVAADQQWQKIENKQ